MRHEGFSNREVVDQEGNALDLQFEHDIFAKKLKQVEQYFEQKPWQEKLQSLDFQPVHNFYLELAKKSGVDPGKLNYIPQERILFLPEQRSYYESDGNYIVIGVKGIQNKAITLDGDLNLALLWVVAHEQQHAVSKTTYAEDQNTGKPLIKGSGYQAIKTISEEPLTELSYPTIDEGLTEYLARQAVRRTVANSPTGFHTDPVSLERLIDQNEISLAYFLEVRFIRRLIIELAKSTDLPEDTVEQALIRGKFSGELLDDPVISQGMAEAVGQEIWEKLRTLSTGNLGVPMYVMMQQLGWIDDDLKQKIH